MSYKHLYKQQTKKLCNIKITRGRAVCCKGFILNRFDRRRVNKLIDVFGNRLFELKEEVFTNRFYISKFYIQKCERVAYFEYESEYEVVFNCTDRRLRSFIINESLWNDLLKYRHDYIDFDMEADDLLYLKTLDLGLGCCVLGEL